MECCLCSRSVHLRQAPQARRCVACPSNLHFCISCDQNCNEIPCSNHQSCWGKHEDGIMPKLRGYHMQVNPAPDLFMETVTCTGLSDAELDQLHRQDRVSRWFSVNKDASENPKLWLYDRFRRLCDPKETGNRVTDNHYPSIVSSIGNTSAGKSTMVRAMLLLGAAENLNNIPEASDDALLDLLVGVLERPGDYTLPVAQGGLNPTTFGVHLYRNGPAATDRVSSTPQYPLLLADCEGFRGGFAPTNAESDGATGGEGDDTEEQVERMDITADDYRKGKKGIDLFYARLLYAVSDVVVFVTSNPKSKADDFPDILEWAAGAMLKTFNQPLGKTLIVVCNKFRSSAREDNITSERLKQEYLGAQEPDLWKRPGIIRTFVDRFNLTTNLGRMIHSNNDLYSELFQSIHFCHIPDVEIYGQMDRLLGHFRHLKAILDLAITQERDIRSQSLIRYNVAELSHFLTKTFEHFSAYNTPLDFYKATCRDNPTPSNRKEHIANFLRLAFDRRNRRDDDVAGMVEDVIALCLLILARRRGSASAFCPRLPPSADYGNY